MSGMRFAKTTAKPGTSFRLEQGTTDATWFRVTIVARKRASKTALLSFGFRAVLTDSQSVAIVHLVVTLTGGSEKESRF
jgi:hypothetical protein